jgi:predicted translin family RNA/ssDNA-binding protein
MATRATTTAGGGETRRRLPEHGISSSFEEETTVKGSIEQIRDRLKNIEDYPTAFVELSIKLRAHEWGAIEGVSRAISTT